MSALHDLAGLLATPGVDAAAELSRFAAENTFPMLEDDSATFVFWDRRPCDAVYLVHWVFGLESRQRLVRLEGTDLWHLTLELPRGSRIEYKYEVQRGGGSELVRDPLNPRRAFDPFGANSVLPMTGYVDPSWAQPDPVSRRGSLESLDLGPTVFGDRREVLVYRPAEFKPHRRYPLIVCHDGADWIRYGGIVSVLDNLIHRHEVIPIIVAFTSGVQRNEEYAANPLHARFLVEDVVPAVERVYRVDERPRARGLMGASFGGVASLHCAFEHPGRFGRLLLNSGSFAFTDIGKHGKGPLWDPVVSFVNAYRADPRRVDARLFLSCGVHESLITYNRSLVPLLRRVGVDFRFVESRDGHNWIAWRDRLRDGLTFLFPGHLRMTYE